MTDLRVGWRVLGNDGHPVGTIKAVGQNYVRTDRSGSSGDLFVPASAVANVSDGAVHLNVAGPDAARMGWDQEPRDADTLETEPESDLHRHV